MNRFSFAMAVIWFLWTVRDTLVICSGGTATTYQALSCGTPVLGIPCNSDQYLSMEAIARQGSGILIRAGQVNQENFKSGIETLIKDKQYTLKAARIKKEGAGCFIGSNLIRSLKQKDWEIIVIDSLIQQVHSTGKWEVPEGVTFFQNDIKDKTAVANALDKVEYIVHLAAETGVGQSSYEIARYVGTNEYGTAVLLEEASKVLSSLKGVILAKFLIHCPARKISPYPLLPVTP